MVGCPGTNVALPSCPDYTEQPEVKANTEKVESLLNYNLPLINQLVDRATEQMRSREESDKFDPKSLKKFLMDKQELLDQIPVENSDSEG